MNSCNSNRESLQKMMCWHWRRLTDISKRLSIERNFCRGLDSKYEMDQRGPGSWKSCMNGSC